MSQLTRRKIVIFTDCNDIAYNEIYQTLDRNLYESGMTDYQIDPFVAIPNFSVINAAFQIRLLSELYGPESLFLVIMNSQPDNPERIFGRTKNGIYFVGNNSGYFNWMFKSFGMAYLYKNHIDRTIDSRSFGGKYVQVPTACNILAGKDLKDLGTPADNSLLKDFTISPGTVIHCDNFGLMKIYYSTDLNFPEGQRLQISVNDIPCCEAIYSDHLKCHPDGIWVLFKGSSLGGLPELGKVRSQNSAKTLNVKVGDQISWKAL